MSDADFFLAAPAAKPVPNAVLCTPLELTVKAKRGILMHGQHSISISLAQACALERSFQLHCTSEEPTRKVAVTGYKSTLDWRRVGRHKLSSTVGGIIAPHWSATARLKLGSPQPVRCRLANVCLLQLGGWSSNA